MSVVTGGQCRDVCGVLVQELADQIMRTVNLKPYCNDE